MTTVACTVEVSRKYCIFNQHCSLYVISREGFSERCFTYNIQSLNGTENLIPFCSFYVEASILYVYASVVS